MLHRFKWAALPLALLFASASFAGGFCDDDPNLSWAGSACPNSRSSLPPQTDDGLVGVGNPQANASELDLRPFYKRGTSVKPLEFDLSLSQLQLSSDGADAALSPPRVEVMRLALMSHALALRGLNGYRVLVLSAVRHARSDTYTLEFSWREEFEPNSAINPNWGLEPGELNFAVGKLRADESGAHVVIRPVEENWANFSIEVTSLDQFRDVPLVYDNAAGFTLPPAASRGFTQPWSLTAGIIGGDLQTVGMTSRFLFTSPYLRAPIEE